MKTLINLVFTLVFVLSCNSQVTETIPTKANNQLLRIKQAKTQPIIDGSANDDSWKTASWYPIDQLWLGLSYTDNDFSGRYKLTWTKEALFILVEIRDDVLLDKEKDPLINWWDDDCLEVFIDEDNSGGNHQYTHSAFAYHIALDGNVVDMSTSEKGKLYNSHIESKRKTERNTSTWEVKILVYDSTYKDDNINVPVTLKVNKTIGFALAYCDNDSSLQRENFIGSVAVEGEDKNRGWIDSDIFGTLILIK